MDPKGEEEHQLALAEQKKKAYELTQLGESNMEKKPFRKKIVIGGDERNRNGGQLRVPKQNKHMKQLVIE